MLKDDQVGVIVPVEGDAAVSGEKSANFGEQNRRYFHWVTPFMIQKKKRSCGKNYWQKERRHHVDCLGFTNVIAYSLGKTARRPVLLSNVLIARLAAELLVQILRDS
ncbi:AroM family protein [Shigella flexneri]